MADVVRETVFEWFKEAVAEVWGKFPAELTLHLAPEAPAAIGKEEPPASLEYLRSAMPVAVGRHLIRYPREATLRVSDELLVMSPEHIHKILLHEAIHLGYAGHGKEFRDVAREVGAVVTTAGLETGGKIEVQKKIGARFKTQREFPDSEEREATAWVKAQAQAEPGSRWRIQFGGCTAGEITA